METVGDKVAVGPALGAPDGPTVGVGVGGLEGEGVGAAAVVFGGCVFI